jgi:hypothetical protein
LKGGLYYLSSAAITAVAAILLSIVTRWDSSIIRTSNPKRDASNIDIIVFDASFISKILKRLNASLYSMLNIVTKLGDLTVISPPPSSNLEVFSFIGPQK